jgi:hypothetical protein
MNDWRNDTDNRKMKGGKENLSQCILACHKSQMKWPRIETELPSSYRWMSNWAMGRNTNNKPLILFTEIVVADDVGCAV